MENNLFFGRNLKFLRLKNDLTLEQIAAITGFSRSQWNNYECEISFPKFLDLIKISKYFGVEETNLIHTDLENSVKVVEQTGQIDESSKILVDNLIYTIDLQKKHILLLENTIEKQKIYDCDKGSLLVAEPSPELK